jgi:hypothetical protein
MTPHQGSGALLEQALARHAAGLNARFIELPEAAVFPHLIPASLQTGRQARCTGTLLGQPAPLFVKRGRSVRYRLSDVFAWLEAAESCASTAAVAAISASQ